FVEPGAADDGIRQLPVTEFKWTRTTDLRARSAAAGLLQDQRSACEIDRAEITGSTTPGAKHDRLSCLTQRNDLARPTRNVWEAGARDAGMDWLCERHRHELRRVR